MEGAFSQPNGRMCEKMLAWARDVTRDSEDHDLLELYCGNGNFTVALSDNFRCPFQAIPFPCQGSCNLYYYALQAKPFMALPS